MAFFNFGTPKKKPGSENMLYKLINQEKIPNFSHFSGEKSYFIDRNSKYFQLIMGFLRRENTDEIMVFLENL